MNENVPPVTEQPADIFIPRNKFVCRFYKRGTIIKHLSLTLFHRVYKVFKNSTTYKSL